MMGKSQNPFLQRGTIKQKNELDNNTGKKMLPASVKKLLTTHVMNEMLLLMHIDNLNIFFFLFYTNCT